MSPILTLQRRTQEAGRIRLGVKRRTEGGKEFPAKLDAFRFTCDSQRTAEAIAAYLGGTARRWEGAPVGEQWEVLSQAREIPVAVPPGDAVISQWFELWSAGGCQRRCDGITEHVSRQPCLCPADPAARAAAASGNRPSACKMTTRVNVIIPDLPGLGVWRLESHGYYAATELAGAAELLGAARDRGMIVPAVLKVVQRQRKFIDHEGKPQTRNYPVPVLEVLQSLRELTEAAAAGTSGLQLPPAPGRELGAAGPALQPGSGGAPALAAPPQRPEEVPNPPADAAACAREVRTASAQRLRELGKVARAQRWMATHVERDGAWGPLEDEFMHRHEELTGRGAQQAQQHEPPPQEPPAEEWDYDPTVSEPREGRGQAATGDPTLDWSRS